MVNIRNARIKGWKVERQTQRHAEAQKRKAAYRTLSVEEKIKLVMSRPGESKKELVKIVGQHP